jgi:glucan phosphoethanolaminetransferase (alkaline phosphatase superfamily)
LKKIQELLLHYYMVQLYFARLITHIIVVDLVSYYRKYKLKKQRFLQDIVLCVFSCVLVVGMFLEKSTEEEEKV